MGPVGWFRRAAASLPLAPGSGPHFAAQAKGFSTYTSTAAKDCRVISAGTEVDDSTIRLCPGQAGLVVLVSEADLRETVSVGRTRSAPAGEPAGQGWFGPLNSTTTTAEWR